MWNESIYMKVTLRKNIYNIDIRYKISIISLIQMIILLLTIDLPVIERDKFLMLFYFKRINWLWGYFNPRLSFLMFIDFTTSIYLTHTVNILKRSFNTWWNIGFIFKLFIYSIKTRKHIFKFIFQQEVNFFSSKW